MLVMRLKDTHELLLQARPCWWSSKVHETQSGTEREGGVESMHEFCETPDTVVCVDENSFSSLISVRCASGEQAWDISASAFHICLSFLSVLVMSVRECGVSCTVKCSSKEQPHLIKNVS